jgi:hypothetical protein
MDQTDDEKKMDQTTAGKKGQSLMQRMTDVPITFGLFGLLLASAAVGIIARATRSYRRSTRLTFTSPSVDFEEGIPPSDMEQQALLE